jgi:CARDB
MHHSKYSYPCLLLLASFAGLVVYITLFRAPAAKAYAPQQENEQALPAMEFALITGLDLIETTITNPPASVALGTSFTVTDTAKNQGTVAALTATITEYYLSTATTKNTSAIPLGARAVPALAAGETSTGSFTVTIPLSVPAGYYLLLACADDTNLIVETNETNNCKASALAVRVGSPKATLGAPSIYGYLATTAVSPCNYNAPAETYDLNLTGVTQIDLTMTATSFDPFVCILNSSGGVVVQDDDSGGKVNSRIVVTLPAGSYKIAATSFSGRDKGTYAVRIVKPQPVSGGVINVGARVIGLLSTSDAAAHCNNGTPANRYSLQVSSPVTVTIDAASWLGFDTHLCVFNAIGTKLAEDWDSGVGTNARLWAVPLTQPGTYYVEVTTNSNSGGLYLLSVQSGIPTEKPLSLKQQKFGQLSPTAGSGHCNYANPADIWQFTTTITGTYTIDLHSTVFDTHVCVFNSAYSLVSQDWDSGIGTDARIFQLTLNAGTYYIEVSSNSPGNAGGSYTLNLQPFIWPVPPTITVGSTRQGNQSSTAANGHCNYSNPADIWRFTTTTTGTYTIDVHSSVFDTHLCVFNSAYSLVAQDWDSGTGTDARIFQLTLNAGTYYIEVSSNSPGNAGGAYTLNLQPFIWPVPPTITVGATLTGNLAAIAANGHCNYSNPADTWRFSVSSGTFTMDAASTQFTPHICLYNSSYTYINQGYGNNGIATLTQGLSTGVYYIEISSDSATYGAYSLHLH